MEPSLTSVAFGLTILATAVMAATAAIQGARQEFDPFGAVVLAIVTAIGGGTLRDLLIGASPVFWLTDMTYLATAVPVALVTYFLSKGFGQQNGMRLRFLLYLDGIGLALFTLVGIQSALDVGLPMASVVVLGCVTGVAGGMFRDVLCGLTPSILKQDLYATISLIGGTIYLVTREHFDDPTSLITAFLFMIVLRSIVVYRNATKAG